MTIKKNLMSHHHGAPTLRNINSGFPSLDRKRNIFILPLMSQPPQKMDRKCLHKAKLRFKLLYPVPHIYFLALRRHKSRIKEGTWVLESDRPELKYNQVRPGLSESPFSYLPLKVGPVIYVSSN